MRFLHNTLNFQAGVLHGFRQLGLCAAESLRGIRSRGVLDLASTGWGLGFRVYCFKAWYTSRFVGLGSKDSVIFGSGNSVWKPRLARLQGWWKLRVPRVRALSLTSALDMLTRNRGALIIRIGSIAFL